MEAKKFLEVEYTPSLFSKRFESRDELLKHFEKFASLESGKSRMNYNCHLNIAYGSTPREKLDIYGDDLEVDSSLFVFIHGGYWQMLDKWNSAYVCKPFVEKGIRVVVVDYELRPKVTLEEIVAQIRKSFKWISDYVKKNSIKSLSISGHSAGSHLMALALTEDFINSLEVDVKIFAYFLSGIYDLTELRLLDAANEKNILSINDSNVRHLSPQFHEFKYLKDVKIYVLAGENESEKFKQQSKDFAEGPLRDLPDVTFKIVSGRDHFDMVENLSEENYEVTEIVVGNALK